MDGCQTKNLIFEIFIFQRYEKMAPLAGEGFNNWQKKELQENPKVG